MGKQHVANQTEKKEKIDSMEAPSAMIFQSGKKTFTAYKITVKNASVNYTVYKRYSEFAALDKSLRKICSHLSRLPSKRYISSNTDPALIDHRARLLHEYLQDIFQLLSTLNSVDAEKITKLEVIIGWKCSLKIQKDPSDLDSKNLSKHNIIDSLLSKIHLKDSANYFVPEEESEAMFFSPISKPVESWIPSCPLDPPPQTPTDENYSICSSDLCSPMDKLTSLDHDDKMLNSKLKSCSPLSPQVCPSPSSEMDISDLLHRQETLSCVDSPVVYKKVDKNRWVDSKGKEIYQDEISNHSVSPKMKNNIPPPLSIPKQWLLKNSRKNQSWRTSLWEMTGFGSSSAEEDISNWREFKDDFCATSACSSPRNNVRKLAPDTSHKFLHSPLRIMKNSPVVSDSSDDFVIETTFASPLLTKKSTPNTPSDLAQNSKTHINTLSNLFTNQVSVNKPETQLPIKSWLSNVPLWGGGKKGESEHEFIPETPKETKKEKSSVSLSDFYLLKLIGKGNFGKVLLAQHKTTQNVYAIKVIAKASVKKKKTKDEKIKSSPHDLNHIMAERNVLIRSINHPFLIGLRWSFQTNHRLYFVTDYVNGGELFFHLQKERRFNEERSRFYAAEIVSALAYLHVEADVVYRDLKPENILLDHEGHIKLTDFGLAKEHFHENNRGKTTTFCGTPEYLAPEVIRKEPYGFAVDWWCLGAVLFEMLVGLPPFYSKDTQEMYEKILHAKLAFPSHVSLRARSIISGLLHRSAHFRLGSGPNNTSSPQSIKLHPFFEGMNWGALERREIKPPYVPDVRHNYDLRNIDPTFVNEPIPNSVLLDGNPTILKNVENKVPWKVEVCATTFENEAFQGFTFVPTSNEGYLKKLSQENE